MKKILLYGYMLSLVFLTACNEETNKQTILPENHPTSKFGEVTIREVFENGVTSEDVTAEKKFIYTDGRLVQYAYTQSYYGGSLEHSSRITYSDYQATVTDEFGNVSVYTLNDRGYAISCTRQNEASGEKREYTFGYTEDSQKYLLSEIKESIHDKIYSQIQIEYAELGHFHIKVQVEDNVQTYISTQSVDILIDNRSDLPDPFLSETYPLSLHEEALYGKLLGDPYPVLITRTMPEGGQEDINYLYELNNDGLITTCNRKTTVYEMINGTPHETAYSHRSNYSFR